MPLYLLRSAYGDELEHESGERLLSPGDLLAEDGRWVVVAVLDEYDPYEAVLLVKPVQ